MAVKDTWNRYGSDNSLAIDWLNETIAELIGMVNDLTTRLEEAETKITQAQDEIASLKGIVDRIPDATLYGKSFH